MVLHAVKPFVECADIHGCQFGNGLTVELIWQRFTVETGTLTGGTGHFAWKLFGPTLRGGGHFVIGHVEDIFRQSFKLHIVVVGGMAYGCGNAQAIGRTVEYFIECLFGHIINAGIERAVIVWEHGLYFPKYKRVAIFPQRNDGTFAHRKSALDDFLAVDNRNGAQTATFRTGSLSRVKREIVRCRLTIWNAAHGIHQTFGIITNIIIVRSVEYHHKAIALPQSFCHTFAQTLRVLDLYC